MQSHEHIILYTYILAHLVALALFGLAFNRGYTLLQFTSGSSAGLTRMNIPEEV